jgi:hypothetical protein
MPNYFVFADESGTLISDRYFGIGVLALSEPEQLYATVQNSFDKIRTHSKNQREKTIAEYLQNNEYHKLAKFSSQQLPFELKFTNINSLNNSVYQELVRNYFTLPAVKFSAIIVDREDPNFNPSSQFSNTWDMYSGFFSTLIAGLLRNLNDSQICLLPDYLYVPHDFGETFEQTIKRKLKKRLQEEVYSKSIFNITRLESHSHLLIQLVDILLGSILYDFKISAGLIQPNKRREIVVDEIRKKIDRSSLAGNYTVNTPSYFSTWKIKFK